MAATIKLTVLVVLIFVICKEMTDCKMASDNKTATISSWNMRCMWGCAKPYMQELMTSSHIIAISEHGLYQCELPKLYDIHPDFNAMGKSSKHLRDENHGKRKGHGGCALLWRKSISNMVNPRPDLGSDRMCVLELYPKDRPVCFIMSVYMPHQGCQISDFKEELAILENVLEACKSDGDVCIIGDMNIHLGSEYGHRGWGSTSSNGKMFMRLMAQYNMQCVDMVKGSGPAYTYMSGGDRHILTTA